MDSKRKVPFFLKNNKLIVISLISFFFLFAMLFGFSFGFRGLNSRLKSYVTTISFNVEKTGSTSNYWIFSDLLLSDSNLEKVKNDMNNGDYFLTEITTQDLRNKIELSFIYSTNVASFKYTSYSYNETNRFALSFLSSSIETISHSSFKNAFVVGEEPSVYSKSHIPTILFSSLTTAFSLTIAISFIFLFKNKNNSLNIFERMSHEKNH